MSQRINKYDTLKGILILCVLLGHIIGDQGGDVLSRTAVFGIYAFHMPLFMVLTGKFAKFKPFDAMLYIVLFAIFDAWFIFALALFYLLIPLFAKITQKRHQLLLIGALIIAGLLSGYLPLGTEHPVFTRCITFMPYFLLGYYKVFEWRLVKHKVLLGILLFGFTILFLPFICRKVLIPLFMCDQYGLHTIWHRIMAYTLGILWTWWILTVTTNKHVPIFTELGKYTLWIYLLHEAMLPLVVSILNILHNQIGGARFVTQFATASLWCALLWPVAILLQKGTAWLLQKLKPLNEWCQKKCMPHQK